MSPYIFRIDLLSYNRAKLGGDIMTKYVSGYIIKKKLTEEDLLVNAMQLADCCWKPEIDEFNELHIPMGYRVQEVMEYDGYDKYYLTMFRIYEGDSKRWSYEVCSSHQAFVIWKSTDFSKNPEYKGDALSKVVPCALTDPKCVRSILRNQSWIYW